MTDELEDLINDGEPEEETETEQETETESEETAKGEESETTSEETSEASSEAEEESEKTESKTDDETPSSDEESWTKAMALDERRKRQALEEELRELRKNQPQESADPEKAPDPVDDPEGYREYLKGEIRAEYRRDMINKSRQKILSEKDDYLEKEKVFMEIAKENPALVDKMNESWDPAQFAYDTALDHLQQEEIRKAGGIEKWRETERERLKKELEAEKGSEKAQESEQVPSLATASSASSGHATPTDEDLSDIAMGDNI